MRIVIMHALCSICICNNYWNFTIKISNFILKICIKKFEKFQKILISFPENHFWFEIWHNIINWLLLSWIFGLFSLFSILCTNVFDCALQHTDRRWFFSLLCKTSVVSRTLRKYAFKSVYFHDKAVFKRFVLLPVFNTLPSHIMCAVKWNLLTIWNYSLLLETKNK